MVNDDKLNENSSESRIFNTNTVTVVDGEASVPTKRFADVLEDNANASARKLDRIEIRDGKAAKKV